MTRRTALALLAAVVLVASHAWTYWAAAETAYVVGRETATAEVEQLRERDDRATARISVARRETDYWRGLCAGAPGDPMDWGGAVPEGWVDTGWPDAPDDGRFTTPAPAP